jgi:CubicO group peptidase (beta-lactamase class C family)
MRGADSRQELFETLERGVGDGVYAGAVALVWREGATLYHEAHGVLGTHEASGVARGEPVERETIYDLASLTKVLSTTTLLALEHAAGRIDLDEPLHTPWARACPGASLRDLLLHRAGLHAHREFFVGRQVGEREALIEDLLGTPRAAQPGEVTTYSDLGFILLGAIMEEHLGVPLDQAFDQQVARRLHLDMQKPARLAYRRVSREAWLSPEHERRIAPTEVYAAQLHAQRPSWFDLREPEKLAHGRVHDDNALVMDGVAGHAGLFGDAEAVCDVARAWLEASLYGLDTNTRDHFWTPGGDGIRRLGWDGQSPDGSGSTANLLGPRSVGHLGFTGSSLWIDPDASAIYVLLSNCVHPRRDDLRIKAFRRDFHRVAAKL